MKKFILSAVIALLCAAAFGKTMVLFKPGDACVVRAVSETDSGRFSGGAGSFSLDLFGTAGAASTALSSIDSICFYDGAALLTPDMLFNAAFAAPAWMDSLKTYVTVDLRNRTVSDTCVIITDPLDPVDMGNTGITDNAAVAKALVIVRATVPSGASIKAYWSAGDTYFSESGWTAWTQAPGLRFEIASPGKRYLKLRFVLKAASTTSLPQIQGVALCANRVQGAAYAKTLHASSFRNEKIVTGPYAFGWESRTQAKISGLVTRFRLDTCGVNSATEFGKVVALLDWVARRTRGSTPADPYPWDLDQVITTGGTINGHCMSYAEVLVSALTGLGYYARHWAIEGLEPWNENNHEVVEYWSNARKKWIYLDPSLDTWYGDYATNEPLSILEMHNINVAYDSIRCNDGHYHYGDYEPVYDWTWKQGYTTCGYMKLTERNNFHSQPSPSYNGFGLGFCGFSDLNRWHTWTDTATPPYPDSLHYSCEGAVIACHRGRVRDFWYTLNQAEISAKRSADNTLSLEFGNSQPFFKQYMVSVDGGAFSAAASPYAWTLHSGNNRLVVAPDDNWATRGLPSEIQVNR
jgi:hypothetical protein